MNPLDVVAQLARTERTRLVQLARHEGLGAEDAVDCVQDALSTFFKLVQRGEVHDLDGAPALLATITRNAARNARRRHRLAKPHRELDSLELGDLDAPLAEALVSAAEDHLRLHACVARLCETQRSVVLLRMLDERPGEDVAALLGVTRGHVDVLLHRAKRALRACMLAHDDETAAT